MKYSLASSSSGRIFKFCVKACLLSKLAVSKLALRQHMALLFVASADVTSRLVTGCQPVTVTS
jgi:hypothetical protein